MPASKPSPAPPTVLVVDDDVTLRYTLSRLAQHAGCTVIEAINGEEALKLAQSMQPDVVVLDVKLPGIDGFEVCRQLKKNSATASIPVVLVTSMYYDVSKYRSNAKMEDGIERGRALAEKAGAFTLIPRGDTMDELPALLAKLTGKKKAK